jgi:MFS family permease
VFSEHGVTLALGTVISLATFVLFYLMTVFALSWGTTALGFSRHDFLLLQLVAVVFFGLTIPFSAIAADRHGHRLVMVYVTVAILLFGLMFAPLFSANNMAGTLVFMCMGLALMGLSYGPLGTLLSELFPAEVRYTGSSLAFNLGGILGASLAPYAATWLASHYGLSHVGFYLAVSAALTLGALLLTRPTRFH